MTLNNMIRNVKARLLTKGEKIESSYYLNGQRNYVFITDKGAYLLKWNDAPFMAAAKLVPGITGIGETVNFETYHRSFVEQNLYRPSKILFQWTSCNEDVYYLDVGDFTSLSKTYIQNNGEKVLVISVKDLKRME